MSSKLFNVYAESEYTFWTMNENDEYKWEGRVGRETLFAGVAGLPCSSTAHNAITTPECTHAEQSRAQWALAWTMNGRGVILLEWIREEHSLNHLKVCLLSIRQWRRLQACNIGDVFRDLFIWRNADCPFEMAIWTVKYGFVFAPTMPPF